MSSIVLEKVSRFYNIDKRRFYALKNFSYSFPKCGLVAICGKSGSGKSTLLNLLSLMDKPSEGSIIFKGKSLAKFKNKKVDRYRNKELGIIFQRYNLLEDETALFNVCFPLLISGINETKSKKKVVTLAKKLNIHGELLNKKARDLSGGEKQRVAILRAIINNPSIILADEPTGALDYENSIRTMDLLKEISKDHLVIMVSHNNELVELYSDEIIYLKDGVIDKKVIRNKNSSSSPISSNKPSIFHSGFWPFKQGMKIFKRKMNKNIISILSLCFGLIFSLLIAGFSFESKNATIKSSYRQIDYGVMSVSHQEKNTSKENKISLIKESRPSSEEIYVLNQELQDVIIVPNLSFFFPLNPEISIDDELIDNILYSPIYSFDEQYIDSSLIIKGSLPKTHYQTIINKSAFDLLKKKSINPFDASLKIKIIKEVNYLTGDEEKGIITDYFIFEQEYQIVGIIDDFSFLTSPKIFYSYSNNHEVLATTDFYNLSDYLEDDISYLDYLDMVSNSDEITSYSYQAFYLDYDNYQRIDEICTSRSDKIAITCLGKERSNACLELVNACLMGMEIFLFISLIGTLLIIGIISFSSFSEDKRNIAIMFSLGANKDDVLSSYLYSNVIIAILSLAISFISAFFLEKVANTLLFKVVGINELIKIPFLSFLGYRFLFPIIISFSVIAVVFISTYFPILFASKISLKEELKEE